MFYIIGIGLTPKQITQEALDIIKECNFVYLDNFTSAFSQGSLDDLEKFISKKIICLSREDLEQKQEFIKDNCCLLVIGNPLSATTHFSVYEEAVKRGLVCKILPGISIFSYKGICGLSEYKFGKTISIVYPKPNYAPTSFFEVLKQNLFIGAHTLCLLDIDTEKNIFMNIKDACDILKKIDTKNILNKCIAIGLGGLGSNTQEIVVFNFEDYKNIYLKQFPQSLIICGELNDFEKEALDGFKYRK
jgi:diphthine synthase